MESRYQIMLDPILLCKHSDYDEDNKIEMHYEHRKKEK